MQNLDKLKKNLSTQWATQSCRVPLLFFKGEKILWARPWIFYWVPQEEEITCVIMQLSFSSS